MNGVETEKILQNIEYEGECTPVLSSDVCPLEQMEMLINVVGDGNFVHFYILKRQLYLKIF